MPVKSYAEFIAQCEFPEHPAPILEDSLRRESEEEGAFLTLIMWEALWLDSSARLFG